jgi:hypothetical protein
MEQKRKIQRFIPWILLILVWLLASGYAYHLYKKKLQAEQKNHNIQQQLARLDTALYFYKLKSAIDDEYIRTGDKRVLEKYLQLTKFEDFAEIYERRLEKDSLTTQEKIAVQQKIDSVKLAEQNSKDSYLKTYRNYVQSVQRLKLLEELSANLQAEKLEAQQEKDSIVQALRQNKDLMELLQTEKLEMMDILEIENKNSGKIYYLGAKKEGKADGFGVGLWASGGFYKGEWKSNQRHGKGFYKWKEGETYQGDFVEGKRTGYGKYVWKDGEYYEGQWLENTRHGEGTMYYANGKVKYKGNWQKDKFIQKSSKGL